MGLVLLACTSYPLAGEGEGGDWSAKKDTSGKRRAPSPSPKKTGLDPIPDFLQTVPENGDDSAKLNCSGPRDFVGRKPFMGVSAG
jgi:hypothetical protein